MTLYRRTRHACELQAFRIVFSSSLDCFLLLFLFLLCVTRSPTVCWTAPVLVQNQPPIQSCSSLRGVTDPPDRPSLPALRLRSQQIWGIVSLCGTSLISEDKLWDVQSCGFQLRGVSVLDFVRVASVSMHSDRKYRTSIRFNRDLMRKKNNNKCVSSTSDSARTQASLPL